MAVREWGQQNPDGTVSVYQEIGGAPVVIRTESMAQNQGQGAAPAPAAPAGGGGGGGTPGDPNRVVQTREGARTMADVRAGIIASGGTPTGDDAADIAKFNGAGEAQPDQGGGGGGMGGGGTGYNPQAAALLLQAAEASAVRAAAERRLQLLEIPQMQMLDAARKEELIQSAARDAWQKTYQQGQLDIQRGTFDVAKYESMAGITGYLPDSGPSKRLIDAYNQGGRGPESWASTLGVALPEAQRLYAAAQRWQQQPGNEGKPASDAVIGQLAMQEGVSLPQAQASFAREKYQTDTTMQYLGMVNDLKKTNPFQYLHTLQQTPESIRGLVNTSLRGMGLAGGIGQAAGANQFQGIPGMPQPQAPMQAAPPPGYPTPQGPYGGAAPAQPAPVMRSAMPVPGATPVVPQQNVNVVPNSWDGSQVIYPHQPPTLPGGNQINARDWLNTAPWLKTLALQGYEQNGQDPSQVVHDFQRSLPRAVGPRRGAVGVG